MSTQLFFLLVALLAGEVYSSPYHGPTAKPVVLHSGYLADTHEVEAAKNAHLVALGQSSHGYGDNYRDTRSESREEGGNDNGDLGYHAIPHVLHDGYIADTHEVAAARAEHLAAVAKAKTHNYGQDYGSGYSGQDADGHHGHSDHNVPYHGPLAKPVVLKSGYLADTHEVAAAKEQHLETLHSSRGENEYHH